MRDPREAGVTRRVFLRVAGLGGSAALAACAPAAPDGPTRFPTGTINLPPTPANPNTTPSTAPTKAPEVKISPEELKARELVFDHLFRTLTTTQDITDDSGKGSLASKILNQPTNFPRRQIVEGKPVPQDADLITFNWDYFKAGGINTGLVKGQGKIKSLQFKVGLSPFSRPSEAEDRANHIQWRGLVRLTYLASYRYVTIETMFASNWDKIILPEPTIPFSPWKEESYTMDLIVKDGQLQPSSDNPLHKPDEPSLYPIRSAYYQISRSCGTIGGGPLPGCEHVNRDKLPRKP